MNLKSFKGLGLGKIPGLYDTFLSINYMLSKGNTIEMNGQKFILDNDSTTDKRMLSYRYQGHEPGVVKIAKESLTEGQVAVDVGTNFGYFTMLFASIVGESGKVYAYESEEKPFNALLKNTNVNKFKNIDSRQLFIGSVTTLDELIPEKIDLVKIDVEGMEHHVLSGMLRHLASGVDILCEIHPSLITKMNGNIKGIETLLYNNKYGICIVNDTEIIPLGYLKNEPNTNYQYLFRSHSK